MANSIQIPKTWKQWFNSSIRYKIAYGGRGGGKSHTIARILLAKGASEKLTIVCLREFQKNLEDSVHQLLSNIIKSVDVLSSFYQIQEKEIIGKNGTLIKFSGIKNAVNFKSFEGVDIAWIEEAQTISARSIQIVRPTIRKKGSEIWFSYNPDNDYDPVHKMVLHPRSNQLNLKINYYDNPWCTEELIEEAEFQKKEDLDLYKHIWLGETKSFGNRHIYNNCYEIKEFDILNYDKLPSFNKKTIRFRYGLDFGSTDPTAILETFMQDNIIYIHNEIYSSELENDDITLAIKNKMSQAFNNRSIVYGDNLKSTISELRKNRYKINELTNEKILLPRIMIKEVKKWGGSVVDNIRWMKNRRKIIIHPRCVNTIESINRFLWKYNSKSDEILEVPEHKYSHAMDAMRYAYNDLITKEYKHNLLADTNINKEL